MVKFKESFKELKKPIVWIHYAIGTLLIFGVYNFLLKQPLSIHMILFYFIYVFIDRSVHGILELI